MRAPTTTSDDLDARIEAYCERNGIKFRPWECLPWEVPDTGPSPWPSSCAGSETWPAAQALRRKIIRVLREEEATRAAEAK